MRLSISNSGALIGYFPRTVDQLRYLAKLGYRNIDFDLFDQRQVYMADDWREWIESVREVVAECGLSLSQAHSPSGGLDGYWTQEEARRRILRSIEVCGMLGIPRTVVHSPWPNRPTSRRDFIQLTAKLYHMLLPTAERWNVELLLENLGEPRDHGVMYSATGEELLDLVEAVGHPLVHVCWDVGHANLSLPDQSASIRALGSHLKALHIQDNMGDYPIPNLRRAFRPNMDLHTFPFFGNTNWDGVMTALMDIGYSGTFNLEVDMPRNDGKTQFRNGQGEVVDKLWRLPLYLREQADVLLFDIAFHILETYGCYEP